MQSVATPRSLTSKLPHHIKPSARISREMLCFRLYIYIFLPRSRARQLNARALAISVRRVHTIYAARCTWCYTQSEWKSASVCGFLLLFFMYTVVDGERMQCEAHGNSVIRCRRLRRRGATSIHRVADPRRQMRSHQSQRRTTPSHIKCCVCWRERVS